MSARKDSLAIMNVARARPPGSYSTPAMELAQKAASLPRTPACTIQTLWENILYVGKSRSLRNRVRSYFSNPGGRTPRPVPWCRNADLDYIVVDNDREALALENNLIKQHKPKFNVLLATIRPTRTSVLPRLRNFARVCHAPAGEGRFHLLSVRIFPTARAPDRPFYSQNVRVPPARRSNASASRPCFSITLPVPRSMLRLTSEDVTRKLLATRKCFSRPPPRLDEKVSSLACSGFGFRAL